MPKHVSLRFVLALLICTALGPANVSGKEPVFVPVKIDGPPHDPPNGSWWFGPFAESCSVFDVNTDGDLDITCGRNWYEAPDWKKHEMYVEGSEEWPLAHDHCLEIILDVNKDGHTDVVYSNCQVVKGVAWFQNPGRPDVKWKYTKFHHATNIEGVIPGDIDGDGDQDIAIDHWSPKGNKGVTWVEHIDSPPWLVEHVIGTIGDTHGRGLDDVNGDGRLDIITDRGWYENPVRATEDEWIFHPDYRMVVIDPPRMTGPAGPILALDINGDGLNDILAGTAHDYGLFWLQQSIDESGKRSFKHHWIERDFSQFHAVALADLNEDGKADLVTGKRLFAHNGGDPGAFEPLFLFWYDIQGGKFERHVISYNHLQWYPWQKNHNPPPQYAPCAGMKICVADLDKNGKPDIVVSSRTGLYAFYHRGFAPSAAKEWRIPRDKDPKFPKASVVYE